MPNFFIADENVLSKHKIKRIIDYGDISEVIFRNRLKKTVSFLQRSSKTPILCTNYKPFLKTYAKGIHISLYHDRLRSKLPKYGIRTVSTHNLKEILLAKMSLKANFIFISPVLETLSHEKQKPLGIIRLFHTLNQVQCKNIILLGGMSLAYYKRLKTLDFKGKIQGFASIRNFVLTERKIM